MPLRKRAFCKVCRWKGPARPSDGLTGWVGEKYVVGFFSDLGAHIQSKEHENRVKRLWGIEKAASRKRRGPKRAPGKGAA